MRIYDLCMKKKIRRTVALVMTVAVVVSLISVFSTASLLNTDEGNENGPYILLDNNKVENVTLNEAAKLRLSAVSPDFIGSYNWQIAHPEINDVWVNISMANTDKLWLTSALISSMTNSAGEAKLRCRIANGDEEVFTKPVNVTISYNTETQETESEIHGTPVKLKRSLKSNSEVKPIYSVVINYLFDDNTIAFEPFAATIEKGTDLNRIVESPKIVGYVPMRRVGDQYVSADKVDLQITNIQSDIVINVIYEPAMVKFTVHHHKQDIYDDFYSAEPDQTVELQALTGTTVGDGLAFTPEQWPGFRALAYERLQVAADGSTNIEIKYDRNYYLVEFDMNGGYGAEPVYTRYEASVGTNDPIRHGYIFDGWELVSFGGKEPTDEQKSMYDINKQKVISVPAANLKYKARWKTGQTKYTMVFWAENPDDDGYSYWGSIENIGAMSGDIVHARDIVAQVSGIDNEQYFEFNSQKSDRDVIVEGDGTTVVNVYYTRKLYTITFIAPGACRILPNHQHNDDCYEAICGKGHVHSSECTSVLTCNIPEHITHTNECLKCGKQLHSHGDANCQCKKAEHTHTFDCWNDVGSKANNKPNNAPNDAQNGQIHRAWVSSWIGGYYQYYIYLFGDWYIYNGSGVRDKMILDPACGKEEHKHNTNDCECSIEPHIHNDSCYRDVLHTHGNECYTYSCGADEHQHVDECYRLICAHPTGHKHTNDCNSASRNSTVKLVRKKYDSYIGNIWPIVDDNNKKYNSGERWSPSNSSFYSQVLVYIAQMPPDDFTLTLNTANYKTYKMQYYLQALDDVSGTETLDNIKFKMDFEVVANYNYVTKDEDFFAIKGFTKYKSNPSFSGNKIELSNGGTVKFYYKRNQHKLEFNNNGDILESKAVNNVYYGSKLQQYYFVPEYPSNLEPDAYQFGGWYTSPGCYDGSEVDWSNITMPDSSLMLYAKWVPKVHDLNVYLDSTLQTKIGQTMKVNHGDFASEPEGTITNGDYVFQGWFYKDSQGVEKAFVFHGIPITEPLNVYAKWSSHVQVEYKIYYKLKTADGTETSTEVAAPTVSQTLLGNNKTFEAKVGNDLYEAYREGYYPHVSSHTVTMSANGAKEFTFWYTYVDAVPYKVLYLDKDNNQVHDPKIVNNNRLSVVTETFVKKSGMMPDAYQKRLILSTTGTDNDGDQILDNNVLIFRYTSNTTQAYYRVVHYVENLAGGSYREFRSEETVGDIGSTYSISAITVSGFEFVASKTVVRGTNVYSLAEDGVNAKLSADGMLIELYYDRIEVDYTVQYVQKVTEDGVEKNIDVAPTKRGTGDFGEQVLEYALDLSEKGLLLVSENLKMLTLSASSDRNIITFFYDEANVSIKYEVVGPDECGTLSLSSENIKAISGVANGSKPTANNGFIFVGWYLDAACTKPVDAALVKVDNSFVPVQQNGVWKNATYYAKFDAKTTNLTISTNSVKEADKNQAFIFTVTGKKGTETENINLTVAITGNGSVTITDLPIGDYTVTNHTEWSWRFGEETRYTQIKLEYHGGSNQLVYTMSRTNNKWLDDNNGVNNVFK